MKKIMLFALLALSFMATASMASDNPVPDCSQGGCNWVR
jgi:hypothetical protein